MSTTTTTSEGGEGLKIYAVEQCYYDNGKVEAKLWAFHADEKPKPYQKEEPQLDLYIDYFVDETLAKKFLEDAQNA